MIRPFLAGLGLTALAALLFAGSFPNPLIENGVPFLAWVAYVPVFFLLYRVSLGASALWGALYGYTAYLLFNYWLADFHPLAGIIVHGVYMLYMALLFFVLRLAIVFFPRRAYLAHWVIWLAYEYVRTLGFLGYPYGITGYSQWRVIPLIQIADIFGVWGVSALVVFPSAWLGAALGRGGTPAGVLPPEGSPRPRLPAVLARKASRRIAVFFRAERVSAIGWLAAFVATLVYGLAVPSDFSGAPHANIALIQHNTDPWRGDIVAHRRNFETLTRLSDEALAAYPRPDMVVWSETAFVSSVHWHRTYRLHPQSWLLVRDLLDYLALQDVPFVIGNDDSRRDPARNPDPRENFRVSYNAALLFEGGEIAGVYRKIHLVPFTEHFPFRDRFPGVYRALRDADTHFWEQGTEFTVFPGPGFYFSTSICFEDSYGYLSREFVRRGAEVLVNLSNKAWAWSLSSQNQQLGMAVFRSIENRRSAVRSTASGQTAGIDPNGRIVAMAPPFAEAWLTVSVPIVRDRTTIYTRFGDFLGAAFAFAAALLLIIGAVLCIIKKLPGSQTAAPGAKSEDPQRRKK
ncbi:MAG: apolipoprotein N-acyltransferase [Treponema sp.]|nr:apolipoprotein N-acyltransferase [Treponema sp.]